MKNLRTHLSKFLAALALTLVVFPASAFAATTTAATSTRPDTSVRGVCLRVASLENTFKQSISTSGEIYAAAANVRIAALRAQASKSGIETEDARKAADARFTRYMGTLHASANGDTSKEIVISAFANAVTTAAITRRASVDQAQKNFTDGVQLLADARTREVNGEALSFQNEILAALADAKRSCDSGTDPVAVRANLHKSLSTLDSTYMARFADQTAFIQGLIELRNTRIQAVSAATAVFSATLDEASQALHTVLQ